MFGPENKTSTMEADKPKTSFKRFKKVIPRCLYIYYEYRCGTLQTHVSVTVNY